MRRIRRRTWKAESSSPTAQDSAPRSFRRCRALTRSAFCCSHAPSTTSSTRCPSFTFATTRERAGAPCLPTPTSTSKIRCAPPPRRRAPSSFSAPRSRSTSCSSTRIPTARRMKRTTARTTARCATARSTSSICSRTTSPKVIPSASPTSPMRTARTTHSWKA